MFNTPFASVKAIMRLIQFLMCAMLWFKMPVYTLSPIGVSDFLKHLVKLENRPRAVVSFLNMDSGLIHRMAKELAQDDILFSSAENVCGNFVKQQTIFVAEILADDTTLLKKAASLGLLKSPSRWIIFMKRGEENKSETQNSTYDDKIGKSKDKDETLVREDILSNEELTSAKEFVHRKLSDVDIRVFSEVMIVFVHGEQYNAKMVYRRRPNLPLVWESYGLWSSHRGFIDHRSSQVTSLRRRNFEGTPITVCTVLTNNDSANHMGDYVDKHIDPMSKLTYYFTNHMIEFINGSKRVEYVDSWGYRQIDGSYDGMVREMSSGRADIAGSPLIMDKNRMPWVEYVCVNTPVEAQFIFRQPPLSSVANIFLLPFSGGVWLTTMALVVMMSACLLVTWIWEDAKTDLQRSRSPIKRVADTFLDFLGVVFQQGMWKEPKFSSGRTVLIFGLIFFMFLFTAYSAYIVALLQSTTNSINTLEDLLASPLRLAGQDTLYSRFYFPAETEPVRKAIWEQKLVHRGEKTFLPADEGVKLLRQGLFAFHVEITTAYDLVQKTFYEEEKCQFKEIAFLQITHPYFSIARDSPFKELFKIGSRRVMESGLQARSNARILTERPRCAGAGGGGGSFAAVQLRDVAPALRCLMLGYAVALVILAAEMTVHRLERSRQQRNQNVHNADNEMF